MIQDAFNFKKSLIHIKVLIKNMNCHIWLIPENLLSTMQSELVAMENRILHIYVQLNYSLDWERS